MGSSASKVRSRGEIDFNVASYASSKWKRYGFIIAIIIGMVGLSVGGTGVAGYFHVGALSHMAQFDAIIMMSVGGGGGGLLLIIVGAIKNCKSLGLSNKISSTSHYPSIQVALSTIPIDLVNMIGDYASEVLYGPEAWGKWGVEVLDIVPSVPTVDLSKNDKVLLYIPQRIRFNGKEQNLTLKALKEIAGDAFFEHFYLDCERQFGNSFARGGWVLIDKAVIPESSGKNYETQQKMVEERGCSMPSALEAATLKLMIFAFTGEQLYGLRTYTCCLEKVDGAYPVFVGDLGSGSLVVGSDRFNTVFYGVACVRRNL